MIDHYLPSTTMNPFLLENNYVVLDNFIPAARASALYAQFRQDSIDYPDQFESDPQCPKSLAMYNYRWFVELLVEQIPLVSQLAGELVLPTYSYARIYRHGEVLKKHRDRPACEISITLHLGSDASDASNASNASDANNAGGARDASHRPCGSDWPIHLTRPDGSSAAISLQPGQAVAYLGCQSRHWRDEFAGQHYGQVFLHYVKSRGQHWGRVFDHDRSIPPKPA